MDRKGYLDIIEVWVEVGEDIFAETMGELERFQRKVQAQTETREATQDAAAPDKAEAQREQPKKKVKRESENMI